MTIELLLKQFLSTIENDDLGAMMSFMDDYGYSERYRGRLAGNETDDNQTIREQYHHAVDDVATALVNELTVKVKETIFPRENGNHRVFAYRLTRQTDKVMR